KTIGAAEKIAGELRTRGLRVHIDKREKESPGFKYNHWEMRGVPVRVEIGPRDLENNACVLARRDSGEKETISLDAAAQRLIDLQTEIQDAIYQKALAFREASTRRVDTWQEFEEAFSDEGGAGFIVAHWDGTTETEEAIAQRTKATIRVIPQKPLSPSDNEPGFCVFSGKPSARRVVFARAY
ncbi:MAG TPA: His/Gly/Thr/Pro-type tRNA ligase C-terminal domain-containing protein, partial [Fimbriimonas sp.]|nr:His/Gly/Thr/Pro-type tRNA ligase C-terminal domain-containing protein [Fimbriimonas sp.]